MVAPTDEKIAAYFENLVQQGHAVCDMQNDRPVPNRGRFTRWRLQAEEFLTELFGSGHRFVEPFRRLALREFQHVDADDVDEGQAALLAAQDHYRSGLLNVRVIIVGEVFTDFLDMAEHLLDRGYKDPGAMLCGAVLEDGLRRIAQDKQLPVATRDGIAILNDRCKAAGLYGALLHRQVLVWATIRNSAAHAKFGEFTVPDVEAMLVGVRQFLSMYLR